MPWSVVGNSLGGTLAVRAAQSGRFKPAAIATLGAPAQAHPSWKAVLRELESLPALWRYRPYVRSWRETLPAYGAFRRHDFPVRTPGRSYLDEVVAALDILPFPRPPICPVRLIQGDRDAVALPRQSQAWAEGLARMGGHVEFVLLPGIGHLDVAVHPAAIASALDFVEAAVMAHPTETVP